MGMYDGGQSSSASLAEQLHIPVILVLDVRASAESAAAVLLGFETMNSDIALLGVILNRIASPRHLQLVSDAITKHCRAEILGYLPSRMEFNIPERHLGLHMGEEDPISAEAIQHLAETMHEYVDLERLFELAAVAKCPEETKSEKHPTPSVRIAVARDRAFCFYYEENLEQLQHFGAELVFFSPLQDKALPTNIQGIYLGGGYPELYAKQLSSNTEMCAALKKWADEDGVVYAECGGFMYLTKSIVDSDKEVYTMAGVFPLQTRMQGRRASLGYREVCLQEEGLFGPAGTILRGHEFHYSSIDGDTSSIPKLYAVNNDTEEGYQYKNVLGGYMHLHFGSNPDAVKIFVQKCASNRK
jgi:cobyrinic acid a,c-diamide synthase